MRGFRVGGIFVYLLVFCSGRQIVFYSLFAFCKAKLLRWRLLWGQQVCTSLLINIFIKIQPPGGLSVKGYRSFSAQDKTKQPLDTNSTKQPLDTNTIYLDQGWVWGTCTPVFLSTHHLKLDPWFYPEGSYVFSMSVRASVHLKPVLLGIHSLVFLEIWHSDTLDKKQNFEQISVLSRD